jgi:DNA-binding SARP family transcriptional activator
MFDFAATYYNWGVDLIKASDEKSEQNVEYKAKWEAALPIFEKLSQMDCKREDAALWETMGAIYARLGMQDKAMKAFDQADKLHKSGK